ncbi:hypothetical protein FJ656_06400 [Schumannella luteola]|uniref:Recombinase A n=1 Tax=Schumannella luteola TaxID=472059 RepID=A0A852YQD5_9MICO|nr:hypothetical protein [Schumannella luteola]NYG99939.1 hypothetical protein [Schumannella luteola]TPX05515.1 hypothetical protein FJ656_06400 [Schumannella luteola]
MRSGATRGAAAAAVLEIAPDLLGDEFGDDMLDDAGEDPSGPSPLPGAAAATGDRRAHGHAALRGLDALRPASALSAPVHRKGVLGPPGSPSLLGSPDSSGQPGSADSPDRARTVQELQGRIRGMQRRRLDSRALPADDALGELLPGGALTAGSGYAISGSTSLALALLRAPSRAGAWCAIVGLPDLGLEAAAGLGLDLDRVVLVPHPGEHWMAVVSALVDVVSVVLVRPPLREGRARVGETAATRLASRLRQREAVLLAMDDWPRAEARLAVTDTSWSGVGAGFGHLSGRQVTVTSAAPAWAGRERSRRLWLPAADGGITPVTATAVAAASGAHDAAQPRLRSVG